MEKAVCRYKPFEDIRSITVAGELRLAFPEHYEDKSLRETRPIAFLPIGDPKRFKVGVRNLMAEQEQPKDPLQILLERELDGEVIMNRSALASKKKERTVEQKLAKKRIRKRRLERRRLGARVLKNFTFSRVRDCGTKHISAVPCHG